MANYQVQRGTYDAYYEDAYYIHEIEDLLGTIAQTYAFSEIVTPIYEQTELFTRSAGEGSDIVTKEMFSFTDRGGRNITMRPELTAGVIRAVVTNKLYANSDLPLKLYYCGPAFRYERPQKGRYRQFTQFGVECVGVNSYLNDVEVITLGYRALMELGFPHVILKINSLGNKESRQKYMEALREYFANHIQNMCDDCKHRFETNVLRILDCKDPEDQKIIQDAPKIEDYLDQESKDYFDKVKAMLDEDQIPYEVDDTLVRGLDYYSHVVFEYHFITEDGTSLGAIAAGGHYDNLVKEIGGPELSSVGLAIGIERVFTLLKQITPERFSKLTVPVYLAHIGEEAIDHTYLLMQHLRNDGMIECDMTFENKNLSAQIKIANRKGAKLLIIVGEDEMKKYAYQVKNLEEKTQEVVEYDKLIDYINNLEIEY